MRTHIGSKHRPLVHTLVHFENSPLWLPGSDFSPVYQTGGMMSKGTLYLSQHYACYTCGKACDKVAFSDVAAHNIGPKGGLNIKLNDGKAVSVLVPPL